MIQEHSKTNSSNTVNHPFEPILVHEEYFVQNASDQGNEFRMRKGGNAADGEENEVIPVGPALPSGKSMIFSTRFMMKTKLKVLNQNIIAAQILVNGIQQTVPEAKNFIPGALDLSSTWNFGKTYRIDNRSAWTLRIEHS